MYIKVFTKKFILSIGLLMAYVGIAEALPCESMTSGNWSNSATWTNCGNGIPGSLDIVLIKDTHVVELNVDTAELDGLTVEVGGDLNIAQRSSNPQLGYSINLHSTATQKIDLSNALINLSAHLTINAIGQDILLGGVMGPFDIHLNSDAETRLMGKIGEKNNLNSPTAFITDATGTTVFDIPDGLLSVPNFIVYGNRIFNDDVLLVKTASFFGGLGPITFIGTINTDPSASIPSLFFNQLGSSLLQFNQNVGEVKKLRRIRVLNSSNATIELNLSKMVAIEYISLLNVLLNSPTNETVLLENFTTNVSKGISLGGFLRTATGANPNVLLINTMGSDVRISSPVGDNNQPLSSLIINTTGTIKLNGTSVTTTLSQDYTGDVLFGSDIVLNSPEVTFQNNIDTAGFDLTLNTTDTSGATKIQGVLSGSGDLIKNGVGYLDFYSINSLTGNVVLNEGQLKNQVASDAIFSNIAQLSLAAGTFATLGHISTSDYALGNNQSVIGNGLFIGNLIANSGAIVSPGLSTGRLLVLELNMLTGSKLSIEINGTTAITEYDQLGLQGGSLSDATLDLSFGFTPNIGDEFEIISSSTPITGNFLGLPEGTEFIIDDKVFVINYGAGAGNDVVLTVIPHKYTISGTISGIINETLTLQNNAGDDLQFTGDGPFAFSPFDDLSNYAVTVKTNPSMPNQTCLVTGGNSGQNNGTGQLAGSDYADIVVTCTINQYAVGGTLSGLIDGTLTLQNNTGNNLQLTSDGMFEFTTQLDDLSAYAVTVASNTSNQQQNCVVTGGNSGQDNGSGQLAGSNVTEIVVLCTSANQYSLGGTVSGLLSGSLILQNNGGDDLQIPNDGSFSFGLVNDLSNYAVTVKTNPSMPNQTCLVTGGDSGQNDGTGQLLGSEYTDIVVTCTINQYAVGGTLFGLINGTLTLQNNTGNNLQLASDGMFEFTTQLDDLSTYAVTVDSNTSDQNQTCVVTGGNSGLDNGIGQLAGSNVTDIVVLCTSANQYSLGGTVSGLLSGSVVLQNNGGDYLIIHNDGPFTFGLINDLSNYAVTVKLNPSMPHQTCTVAGGNSGQNDGSGVLDGNDIDFIVTCITVQYTVSGTVSGIVNGTLTLQNNTGDDLDLTQDGAFAFSPIDDLSNYAVTVSSNTNIQNQTCVITGGNSGLDNGAGQIARGNVDDIVIICTSDNQYSVGGTVFGLINGTLTLQNNGGDDFQLASDGMFTFATLLNDLSDYSVTVKSNTSSPEQTCVVTGGNSGDDDGSGTLAGSDVQISIDCNTPLTTVDNIYTAFEDITLLANDADGSVMGVNDDSVLVNDSDVDGDTLTVVAQGTATGIGGQITLAVDGTFSYVPPAGISGQYELPFDVTDGIHTVGSSLTIDILPVNDAPTFSILGNVLSAELHPNIMGTTLTIPQFAFDIYAGADDESGQTLQFTPLISDSNSILDASGVSISSAGELILNFTGNIGLAIIQLTLTDNGSKTNGGEDTSVIVEFVVAFSDTLFVDDFEEAQVNKHSSFLDGIKSKSSLNHYPTYDESSHSLNYYEHNLKLEEDYLTSQMQRVIKYWVTEVEMIRATGDTGFR